MSGQRTKWTFYYGVLPLTLAFFLYVMTAAAATQEPQTAEALIAAHKCLNCHTINGKGKKIGPILTNVGERHDKAFILKKLQNPTFNNPDSLMPAFEGSRKEMETIADYLLSLSKQAGGQKKALKQDTDPTTGSTLVGMDKCVTCHSDVHKTWRETVHGKLMLSDTLPVAQRACEGCHGPGSAHVEGGGDITKIRSFSALAPKLVNQTCLNCHQNLMTSHHFNMTAHAMSKLSCVSCHQIMVEKAPHLLKQPEEKLCFSCHQNVKGDFNNFSHHPVVEGALTCASCHDVHSGVNNGMLIKAGNDLCVTCHADKKGPFRYDHHPNVAGYTDGCLECHKPHGANNEAMLRMANRGLCLQCHSDMAFKDHFPGSNCTDVNCHHYIHGSQSDFMFLLK